MLFQQDQATERSECLLAKLPYNEVDQKFPMISTFCCYFCQETLLFQHYQFELNERPHCFDPLTQSNHRL